LYKIPNKSLCLMFVLCLMRLESIENSRELKGSVNEIKTIRMFRK